MRDGPAEAERAQARLDAVAYGARQHFHGHPERPRRHERRQVRVQPRRAGCPGKNDPRRAVRNPRSCALTAMTLADRGATTRDASPAAAAAASPRLRRRLRQTFLKIFDVSDVFGRFGSCSAVFGHFGAFLDVFGHPWTFGVEYSRGGVLESLIKGQIVFSEFVVWPKIKNICTKALNPHTRMQN